MAAEGVGARGRDFAAAVGENGEGGSAAAEYECRYSKYGKQSDCGTTREKKNAERRGGWGAGGKGD